MTQQAESPTVLTQGPFRGRDVHSLTDEELQEARVTVPGMSEAFRVSRTLIHDEWARRFETEGTRGAGSAAKAENAEAKRAADRAAREQEKAAVAVTRLGGARYGASSHEEQRSPLRPL